MDIRHIYNAIHDKTAALYAHNSLTHGAAAWACALNVPGFHDGCCGAELHNERTSSGILNRPKTATSLMPTILYKLYWGLQRI
jgi:hypothetical protein